MAAEQQLERSVLERKEREELRTIAQAMALETNSRTKKADMIDQILNAAGVDTGDNGAANGDGATRTRARKPVTSDDDGPAPAASATTVDVPDSPAPASERPQGGQQ